MDCRKEHDMFRIEWNDRPVVRVLGTVMTRHDTLGGWLPYLNGGQSKIGIHESMDKRRYRIYGWRISDKKVTLDCLIQRNMVFHETIGTFHHWKVGNKRMGLTFYTPAEARSFNRGVRFSLEQLSRIPDYASSSASSMCSRLSDEHQSSCTSPASSTGSSSPYETGALSVHRVNLEGKKKHSTSSSSSSSSSRHGTRTRSPKPGRPSRVIHNSTSSNNSTKNRSHTHHSTISSATTTTAATTLSMLSTTTSPRYCDTPSSCDVGQSHFRWPLPHQHGYSANLTFLNRPLHQDGTTYELSSLTLPSHTQSISRDGDAVTLPKPKVALPESADLEPEESVKIPELILGGGKGKRPPPTQNREASRVRGRDNRRTPPGHGRTRSQQQHPKPWQTKTPHLDNLERQKNLKPTEPNSYVFFSSKPSTAIGSQRIGERGLTPGMTTTLSSMRSGNYKPLALIDSCQYPLFSTRRGCPPYQPPQSGTLSIMASNDTSAFYNRSDMYYTSQIDSIKCDAIRYEPSSSLIGSPKKSKYKTELVSDNVNDDAKVGRDGGLCCCPCFRSTRARRKNASRRKDDLAERSKCRYCHEMFNHERNRPGSCREAPDKCLNTINNVTCMCCVHSVFYHCCKDDEGDYDNEPCSCSGRGGGVTKLGRRWTALAALSLICPCLCLYPPLKACHSCGVACHFCGGEHQAMKSGSKQKYTRR